jgi:ABC-type transporter Mla maintaining outer membrane lipid asymmetry ATPase subunit MlaF
MQAAVRVQDVVTRFGAQVVHDGVGFDVPRGEVVALIGGSGSGKSVLLREIIGLVRPASGRIELLGTSIWPSREDELNAVRRRFGMLFQDGALFSSLTVAQNVAVPFREHTTLAEHVIGPLVSAKIALVGLPADAAAKMPSQLSGGMRKRAALARALALEPEILFLDEPTAGVDVELRRDMWELVRKLRDMGVTIILTTHYIDEAEEMADRIGVISKGELIVVEEKARLMKKLGKKQLTLHLVEAMASVPAALGDWKLALTEGGTVLEYTFDNEERTAVPALLRSLGDLGIGFTDLNTRQSSLEDIFVSLVSDRP